MARCSLMGRRNLAVADELGEAADTVTAELVLEWSLGAEQLQDR